MSSKIQKKPTLKTSECDQIKKSTEEISCVDWKRIYGIKGIITVDVSGWKDASGHFTLWDGNHLIYPGGAEHDDPAHF